MNERDIQLAVSLQLDIAKMTKHLLALIPGDNNPVLKELAAASIHMALFANDFRNKIVGKETDTREEILDRFYEKCGCKLRSDE